MMGQRLYRSRNDVILGGVCAGLADYLGISPLVVRLFFVILTVADGIGFLIYLVLWLIVPRQESPSPADFGSRAAQVGQEFGQAVSRGHPQAPLYIGIGLIAAGLFFLIQNLHLPWLAWFNRELFWPILLILAGGVLLWRAFRGERGDGW